MRLPNCVKTEWIENPQSNVNLSQLHVSPYHMIALIRYICQRIDEQNQKMCIAFPAILNLKRVYSRIEPYFTVGDNNMIGKKI